MASCVLPQVATAFGTFEMCFVEMQFGWQSAKALGLIPCTAYTGHGDMPVVPVLGRQKQKD